jgi:hypothetical protein
MGHRLSMMLLLAFLPLLAGCQTSQSQSMENLPEIGISHELLAYYQKYRDSINPLVFAVSQDGYWGSYLFCDGHKCQGGSQPTSRETSDTIARCNEREAEHGPCSVFALGLGPPRKYHLID